MNSISHSSPRYTPSQPTLSKPSASRARTQSITNDTMRRSLRELSEITPFMQDLSNVLLQSTHIGGYDYAHLLLSILNHFPSTIDSDTISVPDRLYVFSQGEVILDFAEQLSPHETRLLTHGKYKKLKLFLDKGETSALLGKGLSGSVFKTINISSLIKNLRLLQSQYRELISKSLDTKNGSSLSKKNTKELKQALKMAIRNSLMAEKKRDPNSPTCEISPEPYLRAVQRLDGSGYVIFPLVEEDGRSISELAVKDLCSVGTLIDDEHYDLIGTLALGMKDIHDRGVVHRDIKPHNLVLTRKNDLTSVKFIDLDQILLSDEFDQKMKAGKYDKTGTRGYRAPELVTGIFSATGSPSKIADMFSFGITCFQLLGICPFEKKFDSQKKPYTVPISKLELSNALNLACSRYINLTDNQQTILLNLVDPDPSKRPSIDDVIAAFPVKSTRVLD